MENNKDHLDELISEIPIPKGYEIDEKKSTFRRIVYRRKETDFSIHNPDSFFVCTMKNGDKWLIKSDQPPFIPQEKYIHYSLTEKVIYSSGYKELLTDKRALHDKSQMISYRLALNEEIESLYSKFPKFIPILNWEDFGEIKGWECFSENKKNQHKKKASEKDKNIAPSIAERIAIEHICQLIQWRDKANGEILSSWCDWKDKTQIKYSIAFVDNEITFIYSTNESKILTFKSDKIRNRFFHEHKDLIEATIPLL